MIEKQKISALPMICATAGLVIAATAIVRQRRRMSFSGASVVITGGSRGLGLEMARIVAAEGGRLTLLARDEAELERAREILATDGAEVEVHRCDVGKQEEVRAAVDAIVRSRGRIDVLINNAGLVQVGPYEHMTQRDFEEAMAVHAWGPLYMMQMVAPHMKRQGGGRIVNISSIGGLVAVPHLLPYCMSKFALTGLSDGMRAELAKDGIRVTTVAPGLMRTGSHANAFFKGQHRKEFSWFAISDASPLLSTSSARAARKIINACRYGYPRLIITLPATLAVLSNALLPSLFAMFTKMTAMLLPNVIGPEGDTVHTGRESTSAVAPSLLTALGDRAILRNNEGAELH